MEVVQPNFVKYHVRSNCKLEFDLLTLIKNFLFFEGIKIISVFVIQIDINSINVRWTNVGSSPKDVAQIVELIWVLIFSH